MDYEKLKAAHATAPSEIELVPQGYYVSKDYPSDQCASFYEEAHRQVPGLIAEIERLRANQPSKWKERADEWHGRYIKANEQLAAVTAARDELAEGWRVQIDESENPSSAESSARHDRINELLKVGQ